MKALEILHNYPSKTRMYSIYPRSECDEAIEEIETLEKQLEEYDSIVVGLNYKLAKAQSYIVELESKLRGHIKENGWMNK